MVNLGLRGSIPESALDTDEAPQRRRGKGVLFQAGTLRSSRASVLALPSGTSEKLPRPGDVTT